MLLKKNFPECPEVCIGARTEITASEADLLSEVLYINSVSSSPHKFFHKGLYPDQIYKSLHSKMKIHRP